MTGDARRFRMPWHRDRPAAAIEHVRAPLRRHVTSVRVGPDAVREARESVAGQFTEAGVAPESAFADAVLLVVSELVTNVLRHAAHSPFTDVGITVAGHTLVISVADIEPRLPDLTLEGMGAGLRMVAELAADYDGELSAEPAVDHVGKVVLVRFEIPQ
ncbi:ATP-binding protein [Streptomyces sp. NPDC046909]|uniref:ATP-binding protein n=1 Tax=Streptomyces sp. NPDC046909 TaxID=3155617 RepID=UPI0033E211EC